MTTRENIEKIARNCGLREDVSTELLDEYRSQVDIDFENWNSLCNFLSHWISKRLIKYNSEKDDLLHLCELVGMKIELANHLIVSGLITSPEMIKFHILMIFLKKVKDLE